MARFNGDDDINVDAEPEGAPFSRHRSEAGTESQRTFPTDYNDRCTSISADDEYKEYLHIINNDIPDDIDILIISDEDDIDDAKKFKEYIQKNVSFTISGNTMVPRVEILDDIPGFSPTIIDHAFDRALFIFLFATASFCSKDLSLLKGYACLQKSLEDKSKRKFVIPVHTHLKEGQPYILPCLLSGLRYLKYGLRGFVDKVVILLENEKNTIVHKMMDLDERKKIHFAQHHERIKKQMAFMRSQLSRVNSSIENKSLACQEPLSNITPDEATSLGCALKDLKMTHATDTEGTQLLQLNEKPIPQNTSHTKQKDFLKEQLLMPDTRQAVAAADTHSSSKSDRTFSAGPSSAGTSVIQHIHHHHHKNNITVANATNVLIGDKSKILNRCSVDVISDDESGDDDDAEDDTEAPGRSGPSNSTRFTENSSGSSGNKRGANDVRPGNEESKNMSMGFAEFLSPISRQPVERSEDEYSARDDGNDQTYVKELF